jgi:peptide subunit release factor 1 (eRF1)
MITRDDIRELANFHSPEGCAVTFYYQPPAPTNQSHRDETILVKDLAQNALRLAEKNPLKPKAAYADLQRILEIAGTLRGNGRKARAIFACGGQQYWREFDLPAKLPKSTLVLNQRFHLKPLAAVLDGMQRAAVVLVDRTKARVFEIAQGKLTEKLDFINELTRFGRTDGFSGYDAGHNQRRVMNEAMQHFKVVSDAVTSYIEREGCETLLVGCHDDVWSEFLPHLHTYAQQRLAGRFRIDPKTTTPEQLRKIALEHLQLHDQERKQSLITEVIGEAHRNGRGAIGLRRVLRSLEAGEVQTLMLASSFSAPGVKCYHCGHMDLHIATTCVMCGKPNTELEDLGDAIVGHAIRHGLELIYIGDDDEQFDRIGRIAAQLRFRADQSTPAKVAV